MKIFHKHEFKESKSQPDIIFCSCGVIKDLHRHIWKQDGILTELAPMFPEGKRTVGRILQCSICGEVKTTDILYTTHD